MQRNELTKFDLPDVPGVYLFTHGKGRSKKVLYVGKATSLRDRVRSYFDDDLIATRGPRVVDMVTKADRIAFETTPTVLEALVREAAKRALGQRPFDVQLLGGLVLHRGAVAEMMTGEGKTLAGVAPAYLNALSGDGVHVVV